MHQAAQLLTGEQDFSSFRSAACQANHAIRNVHWVKVSRVDDFIYVDIEANAFLHHMVRNIVGTLVMIGAAEKPVEWVSDLIKIKDRNLAGPTAAADGLYMVEVTYTHSAGLLKPAYLP